MARKRTPPADIPEAPPPAVRISAAPIPATPEPAPKYSEELSHLILDSYIEVGSLSKVSKLPGMPRYNTLLKWIKDDVGGMRERLDAARYVRAIHFEEEALRAAEEAQDKDDVPAQRLKFDAYQWAASVNDPNRYGKRTTVQGDSSRPITITVVTGVPDPLPALAVACEVVDAEPAPAAPANDAEATE